MRVGGTLHDVDPLHGRCSRAIVYASSYAARQKSDSNQLLLKLDKEKLNYQTRKSRRVASPSYRMLLKYLDYGKMPHEQQK